MLGSASARVHHTSRPPPRMSFQLRRSLAALFPADPPRRTDLWLYAAHLCTIWAIALSNVAFGLLLLRSRRYFRELSGSWQRLAPLLIPLGFYVVFLVVSILFSLEPTTSAPNLRETLSLLTLALGLVLVRGEHEVRRLFDLLILMSALIATYGIAQYYLSDYGPLHNRIPGPFSHYMTLSGVLVVGDLLLLARVVSRDGWKSPWNWLALLAINWTLLLSLTRRSWVAVTLTATAYLLVRARRFFLVFLTVAMILALLAPKTVVGRMQSIFSFQEASNYDRLCMAEAGLFMIEESPLFGIGPGMVKSRYPIYRHPTAPRFSVSHLHNSFLGLAAERGLLSLAAYLWLMSAGLWLAYRAYRREGGPHGDRADLYLGTILVLVGFNLGGLFEDNWRDTEIQRLVLFILAVPCCLSTRADGSEK